MTTATFFATGGSAMSAVGAGHVVVITNVAMTESVTASDGVTPPKSVMAYSAPTSDTMTMADGTPAAALGLFLTQAMTFHAAPVYTWSPGGTIVESLTLGDGSTLRSVMNVRLTQRFQIAHAQVLGLLARVTENLTVSAQVKAYLGTLFLNRVLMQDVASARMKYQMSLTQALSIAAILQRFTGAAMSDGFTIHDAGSAKYKAVAQLIEFLTVAIDQRNKMAFRLSIQDGVVMDDDTILRMIYRQTMTEIIDLEVLYQSLGGGVTAWTVNTRTGAVTEYQGWNFNSFVQFGNKYIAASADGIYELNGDTDNGLNTVADIMGGFLQPAGGHLAGLKGVYLGQSGTGYWLLKIDTGDGREYIYQRLSNPGLMTTKFIMGKGINARYIGWELINVEGQDFDLDSIEFVPMVRGRRI